MPGSIVIGFDGSEIARATLGYVAGRTPGDRLVVAHVLAIPVAMLESPDYDRALERSRELGQHVLDEAKGALPPDTHAYMDPAEALEAVGLPE